MTIDKVLKIAYNKKDAIILLSTRYHGRDYGQKSQDGLN